jgi:hypothetical protein
MKLYQIPQSEGRKIIAKVVMWCVKPRLYSVKLRNSKRQTLFPSLKRETNKGPEREEWRTKMKNRKKKLASSFHSMSLKLLMVFFGWILAS